MSEKLGPAVVFGVGASRGLGAAIARRFADGGHPVVVTGRTQEKLDAIVGEIEQAGGTARALVCDVTDEASVKALFAELDKGDPLDAVIYNAGNNAIIPFLELTPQQFENFWRVCCYGAMLVGQEAVKRMAERGRGSLLFTGASASLRGKAAFGHFASAKAALRNLAQSIAREFGPQGVHVGHVVVDGAIDGERLRSRFEGYLDQLGEDGALNPDDIAEAFWALHTQKRSAWTQELDVRPFKENW